MIHRSAGFPNRLHDQPLDRTQTGAALVTGLILLSILTLLAVSTMNTAATELTLSGNDHYRIRASEAAQTGIERTIATGNFTTTVTQTFPQTTLPGGDSYTLTVRPSGPTPAPPGYNPTFTAEHYEIQSTGRSHRGAQTIYIQGLFVIAPPTAAAAASSATPPLCLSGVEIRPQLCKNFGAVVRTYWRSGI